MFLQFAVLWSGDRWSLLAQGVRYDRYPSRQSALEAAHRLADQARRQGYDVRVLVQDVGGQLLEHQPEGWACAPLNQPPNSPA
jgi:hypothetical protein